METNPLGPADDSSVQPYPPVRVEGPNRAYAQAMLDNLGGCSSEMSAVSLYVYNHLVTQGCPELSQAFRRLSLVEMRHLELFGGLALRLGEDPRLWTPRTCQKAYWTPAYNRYPVRLPELLLNALKGEKEAVRKYRCQAETIRDPHIVRMLRRVIEDEQAHVELLTRLYQAYGAPAR